MTDLIPKPWLGREMLRQGEVRLTSQAAALTAYETRATSLLALCGAAIFGLVAASAASWAAHPERSFAAGASAICLFGAAARLLWALRPQQDWCVAGIEPGEMRRYEAYGEEDCLRVMAEVLDEGVRDNSLRLRSFGHHLGVAGVLILASPIVGIIIMLATKPLG